jgi:hypothetical protein
MSSIERRFFSIYFEKYRHKKILREFNKIEQIIDNLNSIKNKRFNNLNLFETEINLVSDSFNILEKMLRDKKNLLCFNQFFKVYNRLFNVNYNSRNILTAWMIFICPEYILNVKLNDINDINNINNLANNYKKNIYYRAEQLVYKFTNFTKFDSVNLKKFNKILFEFNVEFLNFLQVDKIEKIHNSCNDWMEMEETIQLIKISKKYQQEEKFNIINNLVKTQNELKEHISKFNIEVNYEELRKIVEEKMKFKNLIQKEFKNEIELCFQEKKYDIIGEILDEIKQFIIKFYKKNNLDKLREIEDFFDIEYIIQLFRNDIITKQDIIIFIQNILKFILPLGSAVLEKNKYEELNSISNNILNENLNTFASQFIFFILELINEIIEEIINFQNFKNFISTTPF